MNNRIQISSDAMPSYEEAIDTVFGMDVDYAQIVKTYGTDESKYSTPERKYSPSRITASESDTRIRRGHVTTDSGGRRYLTKLELPPVDSPQTAVKAAIMSEIKNAREKKKGR
jgi:hypothetical protein